MTKDQIVRTAALTGVILAIVLVLDWLVNVVIAPGVTPYTPVATAAITLLVTPAAIAYLILQNAKMRRAEMAFADERVARLAADGANAAKTRFLATMSHELRTPINAIIGYAEIIEEDAESGAIAADSARIQRSARHLLGLINGMLDHVDLEAGELHLRPVRTDLGALFADVAEASRADIEANGNTLVLECAGDVGVAWLDSQRLRQCLLHLASNAGKFCKNGTVSLRMRAVEGDTIVFEAADTGIGISEAARANLFQPFAQGDASFTRGHDGAGLGLALTKQLIEKMAGTIAVQSREGEGATFTLTVPRGAQTDNVVSFAA